MPIVKNIYDFYGSDEDLERLKKKLSVKPVNHRKLACGALARLLEDITYKYEIKQDGKSCYDIDRYTKVITYLTRIANETINDSLSTYKISRLATFGLNMLYSHGDIVKNDLSRDMIVKDISKIIDELITDEPNILNVYLMPTKTNSSRDAQYGSLHGFMRTNHIKTKKEEYEILFKYRDEYERNFEFVECNYTRRILSKTPGSGSEPSYLRFGFMTTCRASLSEALSCKAIDRILEEFPNVTMQVILVLSKTIDRGRVYRVRGKIDANDSHEDMLKKLERITSDKKAEYAYCNKIFEEGFDE